MQIQVRATEVREHLNVFLYSKPGGGKTYFLLSSYEEHGTERRGPVIFDTDKGGVDDTAIDMKLTGKVPIIPVGDDEGDKLLYAITYPEEIVEMVNAHEKFRDYEVTTFGFDTLSSGAEIILGNSKISFGELDITKSIPASGVMKIQRSRKSGAPALGDYKANHSLLRIWLRKARELRYNTIITCHAGIEETEGSKGKDGNDKEFEGSALLPGKLRYDAAKLVDHFFFMEQTPSGAFITHTRPYKIWNARTRIRRFLQPQEQDFTFPKLAAIYEKAKAEGEVGG